jgi:hypothetical protein
LAGIKREAGAQTLEAVHVQATERLLAACGEAKVRGGGAFWGALAIKTRSIGPALVSHVLWDLSVLFWLPYVRS